MIRAFHTLWTRPYAMAHPGQPFSLSDSDLFCMILSAMKWRQKNGTIRLITDRVGARYVCSYGLDSLWDDGIDDSLERIPYSIDPSTFWAAGKLFALEQMSAPCAMLDTDFIVWETLPRQISNLPVTVIHLEELMPEVYPDPSRFLCAADYRYPEDWDFSLPACNTAFCCFGSEELRTEYCRQTLRFIHAARGQHPLHYMVFAEQRMLTLCAHAQGQHVHILSHLEELFSADQTMYTHLWGYKGLLRSDATERQLFCQQCATRIQHDFPELVDRCCIHPLLAPYFHL